MPGSIRFSTKMPYQIMNVNTVQAAGMVDHLVVVLLHHLHERLLIEDIVGLGIVDGIQRPAEELIAGQPMPHWHRKAQFAAVEHVKFQGVMAAHTPMGCFITSTRWLLLLEGMMSP